MIDPKLSILMLMALCSVAVVILTITFPEKFDRILEEIGRVFNNMINND